MNNNNRAKEPMAKNNKKVEYKPKPKPYIPKEHELGRQHRPNIK